MTIAESLKQEGLQTGLQRGRKEGEAILLTKLLQRRFPRDITDRHLYLINEADSNTLSQWGEQLLEAATIDDVFLAL